MFFILRKIGRFIVHRLISIALLAIVLVLARTLTPLSIFINDHRPVSTDRQGSPAVERPTSDGTVRHAEFSDGATSQIDLPFGENGASGAPHQEPMANHHSRFQIAVMAYPWPMRLVAWLAIAALFPLAVAPFTSRGLRRQSNPTNLIMLIGLTAVVGMAAFAILGCKLETPFTALLLIGAIGAGLAYNWLILVKLEELRA